MTDADEARKLRDEYREAKKLSEDGYSAWYFSLSEQEQDLVDDWEVDDYYDDIGERAEAAYELSLPAEAFL